MIDAGSGDDVICGAAGDDSIYGGHGDDVIRGDTGDDFDVCLFSGADELDNCEY